MTPEEYRVRMDDVIWLVGCALNGERPDAERVRAMDLPWVYKAASRHMLSAAAAEALEAAGVQDAQFSQARARAIRNVALMDMDKEQLLHRLEEAGIWYMPLKGIVLKELYPAFGMREMTDQDILFDPDRADDVRRIMESLGFEIILFGQLNHDMYFKPPVSEFEMHRALVWPSLDDALYGYYRDVKNRLVKDDDNACGYHFTPEDFYLFMIAHAYRHYSEGGIGLRSLTDTYVYLKNTALDMDYVEAEAEKLGIADYEKTNRALSLHLFRGEELSAAEREMLEYVLSSGTFGTVRHSAENRARRLAGRLEKSGGGKLRYLLGRFLVPLSRKNKDYAVFAEAYPFFYRHRLLLPLLPFYRLFRALRSGRFQNELGAVRGAKEK